MKRVMILRVNKSFSWFTTFVQLNLQDAFISIFCRTNFIMIIPAEDSFKFSVNKYKKSQVIIFFFFKFVAQCTPVWA